MVPQPPRGPPLWTVDTSTLAHPKADIVSGPFPSGRRRISPGASHGGDRREMAATCCPARDANTIWCDSVGAGGDLPGRAPPRRRRHHLGPAGRTVIFGIRRDRLRRRLGRASATTPSTAAPAMTASRARPVPTCCSAGPAPTRSMAGRATTACTPRRRNDSADCLPAATAPTCASTSGPACRRCSAGSATTSCQAAPAPTSSTAAQTPTRCPATSAPTRWTAARQ